MKKVENIDKLPENRLFREITPKEQERILSCSKATVVSYHDSEYIFSQGEEPSKLFLLLEGQVLLSKNFASGKRNVLFYIEPGSVFGETFLFAEARNYWYDAVAQGNVRTLEIPWKFFYGFCQNACEHHQKITRNMLEILSERNFQMTRKLHLLSGTTLRERIVLWLLEEGTASAGEMPLKKEDKGIKVRIMMNREELADYLGTTRPSLSRELMKMQEEGLIQVEKKFIYIPDREKLEVL